MTYKLIHAIGSGKVTGILRSDGAAIPIDDRNADYAEFLQWNTKQETPLDIQETSQPEIDKYMSEIATAAAKNKAITENLPSWEKVSTTVDTIGNLAEAKAYLKRLSRIVYWLARNKED